LRTYKIKHMADSRVLITGGLGFIGSNLVHKLVSLGANVVIFDCLLPDHGGNLASIKEIKDKVKVVIGDIRNFDLLKEHVKDKDYVFNCAAQVSHIDSMKDPYLDTDINCIGNINVLEACRKFNDKVKIIYAGTRGQIGKLQYSPADENHPDNPLDIYSANKLVAEKYHLIYNNIYGIRATSLRINNTYGPGHQMKHSKFGVLNWFIRLAFENKPIPVFGTGEQIRDYNYVDDVVDAMILAAQSDKSNGEVFLLGSGVKTRLIDLVKLIIRIVGTGSFKFVPWPKDRKAIEVGDFIVSYNKIKKMLGWFPKTKLNEGLKKTVEFYRARLQDYI